MAQEKPNERPEQRLAGKGSETREQIPGLQEAILAEDDPTLRKAKESLEGPDRTDEIEFYSEDILEEDPELSEHEFEADPEMEDQLTLHKGNAADASWEEEDTPEPVDPAKNETTTTRN